MVMVITEADMVIMVMDITEADTVTAAYMIRKLQK